MRKKQGFNPEITGLYAIELIVGQKYASYDELRRSETASMLFDILLYKLVK